MTLSSCRQIVSILFLLAQLIKTGRGCIVYFFVLDDQVFKSLLLIVKHLNTLKVWLKLDYFFLSISQEKLTY